MKATISLPKMKRRWRRLLLLALPVALMACAPAFLDFESDFIANKQISRHSVTAQIDGKPVEISYLRAGDPARRRVILVHGTPGNGANFRALMERVPKGLEFVAPDRPGFGHTRPKKAMTALAGQAAALAPLLVVRDGRAPILLGHSLGGSVVTQTALDYPNRVDGLIQLAAALDPALEERWLIQYLGRIPPFRWLLPAAANHANRELLALEGELRRLTPRLAQIHQPVHIVHGTADELVPYDNVPFMQARFTKARSLTLTRLESANHFLPWNRTDAVLDAIMTMVDTLEDTPHPDTRQACRMDRAVQTC